MVAVVLSVLYINITKYLHSILAIGLFVITKLKSCLLTNQIHAACHTNRFKILNVHTFCPSPIYIFFAKTPVICSVSFFSVLQVPLQIILATLL